MTDGPSSSAEALVKTLDRLPPGKKSAKVHFGEVVVERGDVQAVTQPPHQQGLKNPNVTCTKQKSSRRSSQRNSRQGPVLSASHIEAAAGD
ncbi:hypothetical protein GDO78_014922, partial [Eleutherodactylus coqui]